jgi:thiol-disulfide isomerase/thioredoxin
MFSFMLVAGCGEAPLELADGGSARLEHWTDRWIVINYWAEWCAPCRLEIPELNDLHREGVGAGLVVLGVNYDDLEKEPLHALSERMGIEFPVLVRDPRHIWGYELPQVLPTTVVIAPDGSVHAELVGPQTLETISASVGRAHHR